jgi:hypothetical protein
MYSTVSGRIGVGGARGTRPNPPGRRKFHTSATRYPRVYSQPTSRNSSCILETCFITQLPGGWIFQPYAYISTFICYSGGEKLCAPSLKITFLKTVISQATDVIERFSQQFWIHLFISARNPTWDLAELDELHGSPLEIYDKFSASEHSI